MSSKRDTGSMSGSETRIVYARLPEDEHTALRTWAEVTGKSMTEHVRLAIGRYLREEAAADPTMDGWAVDTWTKFKNTIARMGTDDTTPGAPST